MRKGRWRRLFHRKVVTVEFCRKERDPPLRRISGLSPEILSNNFRAFILFHLRSTEIRSFSKTKKNFYFLTAIMIFICKMTFERSKMNLKKGGLLFRKIAKLKQIISNFVNNNLSSLLKLMCF